MSFLGFGLMVVGVIMIILAFFKLVVPIVFFLFEFVIAGVMGVIGEIHNFLFMHSDGVRKISSKMEQEKNPMSLT